MQRAQKCQINTKVRNIPVNYGIRLSGPVTALIATAASGMVSEPVSSASQPFARYKDALVPRRFSHSSLAPFPSSPSCTAPSFLRPRRAPLTPCRVPHSPQNRYEAASGKIAASRQLAFIRLTPRQRCLLDHLTCASTFDNNANEAAGALAGRRRLSHTTALDIGPLRPLHRVSFTDLSYLLTSSRWSVRPR
jgi:hypothetical protein